MYYKHNKVTPKIFVLGNIDKISWSEILFFTFFILNERGNMLDSCDRASRSRLQSLFASRSTGCSKPVARAWMGDV